MSSKYFCASSAPKSEISTFSSSRRLSPGSEKLLDPVIQIFSLTVFVSSSIVKM